MSEPHAASTDACAEDHPTRAELLSDFGSADRSVQALFSFCFVPAGSLALLREWTPGEDWGARDAALLRYLAVHIHLAIEQGCYRWNEDQMVLCVGQLSGALGAPIYIGIKRNGMSDVSPWALTWVGDRPNCIEPPGSPSLGRWAPMDTALEVVVVFEMAPDLGGVALPGLEEASHVAQSAALAGAVSWSLHRGMYVRQIFGAVRGYFVPVYLTSREDLTRAPDAVAVLSVQQDRLMVRGLLEPAAAYPAARAVVERWEQLPPWLLDAWEGIGSAAEDELDAALERIDG